MEPITYILIRHLTYFLFTKTLYYFILAVYLVKSIIRYLKKLSDFFMLDLLHIIRFSRYTLVMHQGCSYK